MVVFALSLPEAIEVLQPQLSPLLHDTQTPPTSSPPNENQVMGKLTSLWLSCSGFGLLQAALSAVSIIRKKASATFS